MVSQIGSNKSGWSIGAYQKWLQLRTGLPARFWTFFAFVMSAVFLVHIPYTFPNGLEKNLTPGEYTQFRIPLNKAFLWTHLASVLPAGLLAVTQFVPRIRARAMSFHRNAGKVINILTIISTFSAVGIGRVSFGGDYSIQSGVYALGLMTMWSMIKSWTAIRRLQIDEHRKWIIRSWSYQMSVITLRAIAILITIYIEVSGTSVYHAIPCSEVEYILNDQELYTRDFLQCQTSWTGSPITHVAVRAGFDNELAATAGIRVVFGAATWGGLWINALVCEYYLFKTSDESDRLKLISEKRQKVRQTLRERQIGTQ